LAGEPYSEEERRGILAYCWTDVDALRLLLPAMLRDLPTDLDRPLYRGRYAIAATVSMYLGIPVDEPLWREFQTHREEMLREVIADHPVYDRAGISAGTVHAIYPQPWFTFALATHGRRTVID